MKVVLNPSCVVHLHIFDFLSAKEKIKQLLKELSNNAVFQPLDYFLEFSRGLLIFKMSKKIHL